MTLAKSELIQLPIQNGNYQQQQQVYLRQSMPIAVQVPNYQGGFSAQPQPPPSSQNIRQSLSNSYHIYQPQVQRVSIPLNQSQRVPMPMNNQFAPNWINQSVTTQGRLQ